MSYISFKVIAETRYL